MWVWHCQNLKIPKKLRTFGWKYYGNSLWIWGWKSTSSQWGQKNGYLKQTLNSINVFLPSLVMSYVGPQLKLLSMYLYKSMTPFRMNFKLVIKKHWFRFHDYFPGFDSSSNDVMLSVMSKYICFYHFNTISFEVYIWFYFSKIMPKIIACVNLIWSNRCIWFWGIDWILKIFLHRMYVRFYLWRLIN